jgi:hypothetical protein
MRYCKSQGQSKNIRFWCKCDIDTEIGSLVSTRTPLLFFLLVQVGDADEKVFLWMCKNLHIYVIYST